MSPHLYVRLHRNPHRMEATRAGQFGRIGQRVAGCTRHGYVCANAIIQHMVAQVARSKAKIANNIVITRNGRLVLPLVVPLGFQVGKKVAQSSSVVRHFFRRVRPISPVLIRFKQTISKDNQASRVSRLVRFKTVSQFLKLKMN
jgi:hypothetical protein